MGEAKPRRPRKPRSAASRAKSAAAARAQWADPEKRDRIHMAQIKQRRGLWPAVDPATGAVLEDREDG